MWAEAGGGVGWGGVAARGTAVAAAVLLDCSAEIQRPQGLAHPGPGRSLSHGSGRHQPPCPHTCLEKAHTRHKVVWRQGEVRERDLVINIRRTGPRH